MGCSATDPALPEIASSPDLVAGVAWFDENNNGAIDDGEDAAASIRVGIGQGTQVIPSASNAGDLLTDDRGRFSIDLPDLSGAPADDLFVEVAVDVAGPRESSIEVHVRRAVQPGDVGVVVPLRPITRCDSDADDLLTSTTGCGTALLPDLVPLVEDFGQPPTQPVAAASARIDTTTLPSTTLLRFASATANLGAGPLHMIPGDEPQDGRLPTWQRIWTDANQFVDHRTGEFVFHESHDHFHLDGFELYRLLDLGGEVVATGEKVSFCLIDALPAIPEAQTRGQGIFLDVVCEEAGAQQALNPGWADYYGAGLPDQWIDISGVPPGDYLVEIIADPDNLLLESDETNNRATFPVTIDTVDLDIAD